MKTNNYFEGNKSPDNSGKDWIDAFVEKGIIRKDMKVRYYDVDIIEIKKCDDCTAYKSLCGYVSQFEHGGFWFSDNRIRFVTRFVDSDEEATYEDAKEFLERFND